MVSSLHPQSATGNMCCPQDGNEATNGDLQEAPPPPEKRIFLAPIWITPKNCAFSVCIYCTCPKAHDPSNAGQALQ